MKCEEFRLVPVARWLSGSLASLTFLPYLTLRWINLLVVTRAFALKLGLISNLGRYLMNVHNWERNGGRTFYSSNIAQMYFFCID